MIADTAVPVIPRGVRMHRDNVRNTWVLLAPERLLPVDDIGHAILSHVDGQRSFSTIVSELAAAYSAPEDVIAVDASEFITKLTDRRFLDLIE